MTENLDQTVIQRNRMKLLLIAGVPLIMVLASTWLWYVVATGKVELNLGTKNRGTFIQPLKEVDQLPLLLSNGMSYKFAGQDKPWWTFVTFGNGDCAEACQKTLFQNRGIQRTLGKKSEYVRIAYINTGENLTAETSQLFKTDFSEVLVLNSEEDAVRELFNTIKKPIDPFADGISFLIDPYGLAMMYYTPEQDYKDITKDLKILLKMSSH